MRAFLSHSSRDAEFVQAVADELGRQYTWLYTQQFATGDEFLEGMERGLRESGVFVLFASRAALESVFVAFEITEARHREIVRSLDRVLVFLLEPDLSQMDLPKWLRRSQATHASAPKPVARTIRDALDEVARSRQKALFVGRSSEVRALEGQLFPTDGSSAPRVMVLVGLPGVGRRTLAERVARDHWSLKRLVQVKIESGDAVGDVATKLADLYSAYNTVAGLRAIAGEIALESDDILRSRIEEYLRTAVRLQELPVFVDAGGLLGNDGEPSDSMNLLLDLARLRLDLYVAFVSSRRPRLDGLSQSTVAVVSDVHSLSNTETRQLISALGIREQLVLAPTIVTALADAAAGYPPAAYHAIELVRTYGGEVVANDRARLIASRMAPLGLYLSGLQLGDGERGILRVLASSSPLPFAVLGSALSLSPEQLGTATARLIDACLVVPDEDTKYEIAEPIKDIVAREFGASSKNEFALVADALDEYIKTLESDVPRLDLARVLYRALVLAGDEKNRESAFALASDLVSSAERLYHRRDYRRAVEYARQALEVRPKNFEARSTLTRALIKLGEFEQAAQSIEFLRRAGHLRESAFLTGFRERHKGHARDAIRAYETALERGFSGLAIHRELAQCYLALGDVDEAQQHIDQAMRNRPDNRFIIDLQIQIAVRRRDEITAVEKLVLLEIMDAPEFYHHRRSTVLASFGHNTDALEAARQSLQAAGRPTFAMLSQVAVCEMRMGNLDAAAKYLHQLEHEYPKHHHDVRVGLRCQLEIAHRRFRDALTVWEQLADKHRPVHLALRKRAIAGLLTGALTDAERFTLHDELTDLEGRLADYTESNFDVVLD